MRIYTIGFAGKPAARFFETLAEHEIRRVVDIRLHNTNQLAGFTKRSDLPFFLERILGAEYVEEPLFRPTADLLDAYRGRRIGWPEYERAFLDLLAERRVETAVSRELFDVPSVLLCSEGSPARCHRRLVAEYLGERWADVEVVHF